MIYYSSPYKQFFRAFIRAIRTFISSLFSKRLLIMIIIALFIMLLHSNIHAETNYAEGFSYRQTSTPVYNDETEKYDISYRIYTGTGLKEGTISLPADIYNRNQWVLFLDSNNQFKLYNFHAWNVSTYYIRYMNNKYYLTSWLDNDRARNDQWRIYTYNSNNDTWSFSTPTTNTITFTNKNDINPNSIIYSKVNVTYYKNGSSNADSSYLINFKVYKNPNVELIQNKGFRLHLNDYIFSSSEESEFEFLNQSLESIKCSVYDLDNETYITQNLDIYDYTNILGDDDTGYYLDATFDEYFNFMNKFDSNYLIKFKPNLNTLIIRSDFENYTYFNFPALFTCSVNIHYKYYSNLNAGVIRIVDDNGNLIQGQKPFPTEEELSQQLAQEEAERKEQEKEQARLDAINGVTNAIDNSTNSILSTEANNITMEDFGVSSPTIEGSPDLTNIFNLIYNSFMSVYEDDIYRIQFKLPRGDTTFNYDISSNALRSKLPDGLIVLISVFWWVVLGGAVIRFIVRIIHQIVTYSNGSIDGSSGGFLSELTMTPTEFVLFNILH